MIASREIPPVVAIFIDSKEDTREKKECSDPFSEIITKELIPWIR